MNEWNASLLHKKVMELTGGSAAASRKLAAMAVRKQVPKGHILLHEGEICRMIYFVEQGYLRLFSVQDGTEMNTDFIFEDQFATQLKSLRHGVPSDTCIQAGESAVVYELDGSRLRLLYEESEEIAAFGRALLEQLLMEQEEQANRFKRDTPKQRYHHLASTRPEMLQRVSLTQLASYLGVTRETLSRIRKTK